MQIQYKRTLIRCQACRKIIGWTNFNNIVTEWKGELICEDCLAEKEADRYARMPLEEFLNKISDCLDDCPEVTIKNDKLVLQYSGTISDAKRAAKLLEYRGVNYSASYFDSGMLMFTVAPVNGGKLEVV
jgi:hypothetical protein